MSLSPLVRHARSQDVPLILSFIRAAAEEQAPEAEIGATEQALSDTLHLQDVTDSKASRIAWPLLIYSPDDVPAGLLIYFFNYSTWSAAPGVCLEELYVVPKYRRDGYARLLVEAMASAAEEAGCVKMDWVCLMNNEKALRFYDKLGAKRMEDWAVLKVDKATISRLSGKDSV
ncbi:acyl-CoA N-acyltransferase [Aaosphaeria arxii CBS 175.79]|uniref:Acyl-CoA N-acyltransferase n=1 Tax=Aaosphaeria arxii CBS 175.79 TaxID=1450172 RepID=A0A6A5Y0L5_9PLEO|nr:acyl-CoA N-acyltransferase [Aaosphaeria arxii CBS 175.79]KAF2019078.1 acyl-CoA N-acyltransferase [Aaosphaeria arxii CBS 175.79]